MPRTKTETYVANQVYSIVADTTNENSITAVPTWCSGITVFHIDATPVYVKLYNKATAAAETDTPVFRIGVPANAVAANGSGSNITFPEPIYFSAGLSVRVVTGITDASDGALTADECLVNVHYATQ